MQSECTSVLPVLINIFDARSFFFFSLSVLAVREVDRSMLIMKQYIYWFTHTLTRVHAHKQIRTHTVIYIITYTYMYRYIYSFIYYIIYNRYNSAYAYKGTNPYKYKHINS